jgi:hypothetical protein
MRKLSAKQTRLLEDLLRPNNRTTKPIVDRFIRKYHGPFRGDVTDIRSICSAAILAVVRAYGGKPEIPCPCKQATCTRVVRAAYRAMRNALYNRADALNTQKRGGRLEHLRFDGYSGVVPRETESNGAEFMGGDDTDLDAYRDINERGAARQVFAFDNPLDAMIQKQIEIRTEQARVFLTPVQQRLLDLALNPTRPVLTLARKSRSKRAVFFAAKRVAGASRTDAARVEATTRAILS